MMARPVGSKVIQCPNCGEQVVALVGKVGICKYCHEKVRFTKKLMKQLKKSID